MYLFIHHCDLRVADNTTINYLIENGLNFQPIFIGTPDQLEDNPYKSANSIRFMIESLQELSVEYNRLGHNLEVFYGNTTEVVAEILKTNPAIKGIAFNRDYSPYAVARDQALESLNVEIICLEDKLLNPVEAILTGKGTEYSKYTPYFNNASGEPVRKPRDLYKGLTKMPAGGKMNKTKYDFSLEGILSMAKPDSLSPEVQIHGGRSNGLKILQNLGRFVDYNDERNVPTIPTTRLSAYLKFGCISAREAFYAVLEKVGPESELVKQLYWRDFYSMILHYYGTAETPVSITKPTFNDIQWVYNPEHLQRWKDGMTGCPIVDAGMREMNTTGFMHNRLRMIVASYLIFYLRIDWRDGMRYFSQKLVDIDWANNVGNWQWTAGVEKWSNDYYKVFSMESQVERFDPDCQYIKQWVPELANVPAKDIIHWDASHTKYPGIKYPKPIISNNKEARKEGIQMYKEVI